MIQHGGINSCSADLVEFFEISKPELYVCCQGKTEEGIKLAQAALTSDSRYVSLEFLGENLWGQRLLQDTEKMFNHPKMKDFIARLPQPTPEVEEEN